MPEKIVDRCQQVVGDSGELEFCGEPATVHIEEDDRHYCASCWEARKRVYTYWGLKP